MRTLSLVGVDNGFLVLRDANGRVLDICNGLLLTVIEDLPKGAGEAVHLVGFTPEPRVIELEFALVGEQEIMVGELMRHAMHYLMKPRLGVWLTLFATILGRVPPDLHAWILPDDVPAFVGLPAEKRPPGRQSKQPN